MVNAAEEFFGPRGIEPQESLTRLGRQIDARIAVTQVCLHENEVTLAIPTRGTMAITRQ